MAFVIGIQVPSLSTCDLGHKQVLIHKGSVDWKEAPHGLGQYFSTLIYFFEIEPVSDFESKLDPDPQFGF